MAVDWVLEEGAELVEDNCSELSCLNASRHFLSDIISWHRRRYALLSAENKREEISLVTDLAFSNSIPHSSSVFGAALSQKRHSVNG